MRGRSERLSRRVIEELGKLTQELPIAPKGYAAGLVKEDRNSG